MTERIVQKIYETNIQLALIAEQLEKLNKNIEQLALMAEQLEKLNENIEKQINEVQE